MGILPKNRKISRAIIMTWEEEVPPEASGFQLRPRPEVSDRAVLTPGAAGIKKSARGSVALLLADLAHPRHRQPERSAKPFPWKDKSTALRATHSPIAATEGGSQGKAWVTLPPRQGSAGTITRRPAAARYPGRIFGLKFLGIGRQGVFSARGGGPGKKNGIGEK